MKIRRIIISACLMVMTAFIHPAVNARGEEPHPSIYKIHPATGKTEHYATKTSESSNLWFDAGSVNVFLGIMVPIAGIILFFYKMNENLKKVERRIEATNRYLLFFGKKILQRTAGGPMK